MHKIDIYQEERPWGNFRQFTKNINSTVKIITVKPNESLSLQSHQKRSEFWRILTGNGIVQINDTIYNVVKGEEYEISVGEKHRIKAGDQGLEVLEISLGDFDENDIVRYEDKYNRK